MYVYTFELFEMALYSLFRDVAPHQEDRQSPASNPTSGQNSSSNASDIIDRRVVDFSHSNGTKLALR